MTHPYFDTPTQVMFYDIDEPGSWNVGIAYRDEIICACCGGTFDIAEVCELAAGEVKQAIYPYDTWIDLSDEIYGGELPQGLELSDDEENIVEVSDDEEEYEQLVLEDEEAVQAAVAVFANSWVDGVAMPSF